MDYHSPVKLQHIDALTMDNAVTKNEGYLEYRDIVFRELKSTYKKRKSDEFAPDVVSPTEFGSFALSMEYPLSPALEGYGFPDEYRTELERSGSNSIDELSKDSPTQQPAWDDSDLKTDLIITSPLKTVPGFQSDTPFLPLYGHESVNEDICAVDAATDLLSQHTFHSTTQGRDHFEVTPTPPLSPSSHSNKPSPKSHILKQKNDRRAVLQKLSSEEPEHEDFTYGNNKPWYNPKLERLNSQNLKICYINDTSSSSEGEEWAKNKEAPSPKPWVPPSPFLTPLSPTLLKRSMLNRMQSSSSVSSTSSGDYPNLMSSPSADRDIINVRATVLVNESPKKVLSRQEELEQQAKIAFAQAHQEAKRLAEEERAKSRKSSSSSFEKLSLTALSGEIRSKVKSRSLKRNDCREMSVSQLQVILNSMHSEKEDLNAELKFNLEKRDELRTEQDAKLVDVEDLKAMLSQSGPETTV